MTYAAIALPSQANSHVMWTNGDLYGQLGRINGAKETTTNNAKATLLTTVNGSATSAFMLFMNSMRPTMKRTRAIWTRAGNMEMMVGTCHFIIPEYRSCLSLTASRIGM